MNKKIVHDALILTAFTLVLGCVLGVVHGITKAPIDAANQAASQAAYKKVFENAASFLPNASFDAATANSLLADNKYEDEISDVQTAYDDAKNVLGYVITVTAKDGSQDNITFSVGIQMDGTVNGYSIIKIAETPGLGMKAADDDFISQFKDKLVDKFTVVKRAPASDNEIEAISGSTITSDAMANGVNACILYFQKVLSGGGNS